MKINISKATIKDLETIIDLNYRLFKHDYRFDKTLDLRWTFGKEGRKYLRNRINKADGCALAAKVDGKIVGYLIGGFRKEYSYRIKKVYTELENILIIEEFRRQGIGKRLIRAFCEWSRNQKADYVCMNTYFENLPAIRFYKKNGFKELDLLLRKRLR